MTTRFWKYQPSSILPGGRTQDEPGGWLVWMHTQEADPVACGRDLANRSRGRSFNQRGVLLNEFLAGTTPTNRHPWGTEDSPRSPIGLSNRDVEACMQIGSKPGALEAAALHMHKAWLAYRDNGGEPCCFVAGNVEIRPNAWNPHFEKAGVPLRDMRSMAGLPATMSDRQAQEALDARALTALAAAFRMVAIETYFRVFPMDAGTVFVNIGQFNSNTPVYDKNGWPMGGPVPLGRSSAMFFLPGSEPLVGLSNDCRAMDSITRPLVPVLGDVGMDRTRGKEWWPAWAILAMVTLEGDPSDLVVWFNRPPFGPGMTEEEEQFMAGVLDAARK